MDQALSRTSGPSDLAQLDSGAEGGADRAFADGRARHAKMAMEGQELYLPARPDGYIAPADTETLRQRYFHSQHPYGAEAVQGDGISDRRNDKRQPADNHCQLDELQAELTAAKVLQVIAQARLKNKIVLPQEYNCWLFKVNVVRLQRTKR